MGYFCLFAIFQERGKISKYEKNLDLFSAECFCLCLAPIMYAQPISTNVWGSTSTPNTCLISSKKYRKKSEMDKGVY